jgi:CDP-glucose 4,6-dehydratase
LCVDVVCLVSQLVRSLLIDQVKVLRGDVLDQALLERQMGEYEIDTVIHLVSQTIVGIANRNSVATFETNLGGNWVFKLKSR